jgi:hypothetical protein
VTHEVGYVRFGCYAHIHHDLFSIDDVCFGLSLVLVG